MLYCHYKQARVIFIPIMKKTLFFSCLLLFTASLQANSAFHKECEAYRDASPEFVSSPIKYPEGLLWEVTSPKGAINYLFGTIHSQDRRVTGVPSEVRLALTHSNRLFMEAIPSREAGDIFFDAIYRKDESSIQQELSAPMYDALRFFSKDYGLDMQRLDKIKPWAAFSIIGRPKPVQTTTLEMNLLQIARNRGIAVDELESVYEMIDAMDNMAVEDQMTILKDTLCNYKSILEDAGKLVEFYMHRNLQGIYDLNNQAHKDEALFQRFMERIVYQRNRRFQEKLLPYFAQGNQFAAVGASHLIGKQGLLDAFIEAGYKIKKIY